MVSSKRGRKRNDALDVPILEAAIDLLAEIGYDGMTMDAIAARANAAKATVYRRWTSKGGLVLEAMAHVRGGEVDPRRLPDTGTLRGDLLGLFANEPPRASERKIKALGALVAALSQHPELAGAGAGEIAGPWIAVNRVLIRRALARGEIRDDVDVETAARVIPSMATHRTLIERMPFDRAYLIAAIDRVLLPALRTVPARGE